MTGAHPTTALPRLMVAPNGARRMPSDHPALPVTIDQIVAEARACHAAGAGGLHAHVRDAQGRHVLDAGLYRELLAEMAAQLPGMVVQITTEAVGRYSPEEQRRLVRDLCPARVSIALREMAPGEPEPELRRFYHAMFEAGVGIQHILYAPEEVDRMRRFVAAGTIPSEGLELMFVLGSYAEARAGRPEDLAAFLARLGGPIAGAGWAVCAFGPGETACLTEALRRGGKVRVGFENNLYNADGTLAASNAERVAEIARAAAAVGESLAPV